MEFKYFDTSCPETIYPSYKMKKEVKYSHKYKSEQRTTYIYKRNGSDAKSYSLHCAIVMHKYTDKIV